MPLINLQGEREATTQDSEEYGKKVIEILNLRGYALEHDSNFEGTFEDKIFKNPKLDGDIKTIVEIKNTTLSLSDQNFLRELGQYAKIYQKKEFNFIIYARELTNITKWKKIFDIVKQDEKDINQLFEKVLKQDGFEKLDNIKFVEFINRTKVYQVSYSKLIQKIEELKQGNIFGPEPDYLKEEENLEYKKESIESNLYFVKSYPKHVFRCKFRTRLEIKNFWRNPRADTFVERGGYLYSIREFSSKIIKLFCDESTIEKVEWSQIQTWDDYNVFLGRLIKSQIILKAYDEKFYFDRNKKIIYKPHIDLKTEKFKVKLQSEKTRYLTRVFNKKDKTINFVLHRAIKFDIIKVGKDCFAVFNNFRVFSLDGKHIIIGDHAKRLNDKFLPLRAYNNTERSKLHFLVKAIGLTKYNILDTNQFFFESCLKLDIDCKAKVGEVFQENFDYEENIYPTLMEYFEE